MSLAIVRCLRKSEQEPAVNLVRLLSALTPESAEEADPGDYCDRDREFVDRLKYLTRADPAVLSRIRLTRAKALGGLPVLSHEWEELILSLNLKGFYDSGLDISYATFHGNVDLRGAVIGGDYDASHSTVLGDCNEQKLLVLGSIIEDGRSVRGEHLIGAQVKLDDHSVAQSVRRPDVAYEIDLSELDEEARVTASGDRISLGIKVDIDLSGVELVGAPPDPAEGDRTFPSDATTLRSVTPEQLEEWRKAQFRLTSQRRRSGRRDPAVSVVRIPRVGRLPADMPAPGVLTEDDILAPRKRALKPPAKPRLGQKNQAPPSIRRPKYLPEKQARSPRKPRRDWIRPPAEPAQEAQRAAVKKSAQRTKRGPSMGQSPAVSLRTIDKSWDRDTGDKQ